MEENPYKELNREVVSVFPWVRVEWRLPCEGKQVLTFNSRTKGYAIDYIVMLENEDPSYIWACTLQDEYENVTHWMPLPDSPLDKRKRFLVE